MSVRNALVCGLAAVALAVSAPAAQSATGEEAAPYRLVKTVPLGAPDRWDYLAFAPSSHRVYLAHGDRLTVVDGRSGAVIGAVLGIPGGTHGIGFSAGKGFTDDGHAGVVVVFDPTTLKAVGRIPALPDADGITIEPTTGHVFVADGDSGKLTVIDPRAEKVAATLDGGGGLEFLVADGKGHVYVNGAEKREVLRVDARTNSIDARWPIPDCASPHGLAIDPAARRLFVSCENQRLTVLDADTGDVVATLPIGLGSDAVVFDPVRHRVFSSNYDGTLTVIAEETPDRYAVIDVLKTKVTGRTMALDPRSGRLYIAAASIDPTAPPHPGPGGRMLPAQKPGSLALLIYDPVR